MVDWVPIIAIGAVVAFFGGFLCGPLKLCPGNAQGGSKPFINTPAGNAAGIQATGSAHAGVAYAYPAHVTVA